MQVLVAIVLHKKNLECTSSVRPVAPKTYSTSLYLSHIGANGLCEDGNMHRETSEITINPSQLS